MMDSRRSQMMDTRSSWQSYRSTETSRPPPPSATQRRATTDPAAALGRRTDVGRSEQGTLLTEPTPGLDSLYDGAADMTSIAYNMGKRGGRWVSAQAYSSTFNSTVKREFQKPLSREQQLVPMYGERGGPLHYDPWGDHAVSNAPHILSAGSVYWFSRGRYGPIGVPFDSRRKSPQFASNTPRYHFQAKAPPSRTSATIVENDCFVLKSDARKERVLRNDLQDRMRQRVVLDGFLRTHQRPCSAPNL